MEGVLNQADVPILHDYYCSRSDWYGSTFHPEVSFCAGYKSGMKDACSVRYLQVVMVWYEH